MPGWRALVPRDRGRRLECTHDCIRSAMRQARTACRVFSQYDVPAVIIVDRNLTAILKSDVFDRCGMRHAKNGGRTKKKCAECRHWLKFFKGK